MEKQKKKNWNSSGWTDFETDFYRRKPWRSLRAKIVQEEPLCSLHIQFGVIVPGEYLDHIIPRRILKELELEPDNCQHLCRDCHNKKTGLERSTKVLEDYLKEMKNGKLMHICTPEKKKKLIEMLKEKGHI